MLRADGGALWKQAVGQALWGRRGLVKVASLWLPLGALASWREFDNPPGGWLSCLLISFSVACWSQVCILANDLADGPADAASGKERWILRVPRGWAVAGVLLLLALGALGPAMAGAGAFAVYLGGTLLGLCYSVRPLRLKERGLWGPFAYSASGVLCFVLLPAAWLGGEDMLPLRLPLILLLALAVYFDKWTNLLFHQVLDYEADSRSGTLTFAVEVGPSCARLFTRVIAWHASVAMVVLALFCASAWSLRLPVAGAGATAALLATAYAALAGPRTPLLRELPATYLGLTFGMFRVGPLALFASLAHEQPPMWSVLALAALCVALESWHSLRYRCE